MTTTPLRGRIGIRVTGTPIPQGSKQENPFGRGVRDTNAKKLHPWRDHVDATARDATRYHDTITGPVRVWLTFAFDRPKSHYRTGRNATLLKDTAPPYPTSHVLGDGDKLTRAVFDSLTTAGVWADDSLVVEHHVKKLWAGESEHAPPAPGVDIVLEELT